MSDPLVGVVVSHGGLARGFVEAVQQITGEAEALVPVSNDGCTRDTLSNLLKSAVGDKPAVVFVDLPAGSCLQAAARLGHEDRNVAVVAGVNLAMLVDFVYHRAQTPKEAAERAAQRGGGAIKVLSA
jgi:mannose/fructose-specific phosphotransferase system component IIA